MKEERIQPNSPILLMITTESMAQARSISQALLQERAVACTNLAAGIESHYWWKGNLETSNETLLIAKTLAGKLEAVREIVRKLHSYEVFELIAIPLVGGSPDYLDWIAGEVLGGVKK